MGIDILTNRLSNLGCVIENYFLVLPAQTVVYDKPVFLTRRPIKL